MATTVSVIIPCFNHGQYLSKAIESVLDQKYPSVEIVVVDDGSSDNTRQIATGFHEVKYIYQSNQGLSEARNTGIENSIGNYLVFLDADDWLLEKSLQTNAAILDHDRSLGFVSGGFLLSRPGLEQEVKRQVNSNHYIRLLQENYISMHATVMYNRKVFKTIKFDPELRACEDYDVPGVARDFPVAHHTHLMAAYWQHDSNMSSDLSLMMHFALQALSRQKDHLRTTEEKIAYEKGLVNWKEYYALNMYARLVDVRNPLTRKLKTRFKNSLWKHNRKYYLKYKLLFPFMPLRKLSNRKNKRVGS